MAEHHIAPDKCDCGAERWTRVYYPLHPTRASYPDGHKRKGWDSLKEAQKLEKQAAVEKNRDTKRAIKAEITKMGVKASTKG
jgi:hypothetical protein